MNILYNKFTKELLNRDCVFFYTFFALLFKSVLFIGFLLNKTHVRPDFFSAFRIVFSLYLFRSFYFCGFILLFLSFAYLMKNRIRLFFLIALNLFLTLLIFTDLLYLRGFNTMPTLHALQMGGNIETSLISSITSLLYKYDLLLVLDIPLLILFCFVKRDFYRKIPLRVGRFVVAFVLSIVMIAVLAPVSGNLINHVPEKWIFNKFDAISTTFNISPIGFNVRSVYSFFIDNRPVFLTSDEDKRIKAWFDYKKEILPDNQYKALFKGKNLVVLQVESLEKFVIGQKVDGQEITPNLNKLLKNSLYFTGIHEQVGEGTTSDAEFMANTSIYPNCNGSIFFSYPNNRYYSMPKLLKNLGYSTIAIHPDEGSFWNWMPALSSIGFEKCIDSSHYNLSEKIGLGISDGSYLRQVEPILAKEKQPFYSFMITLSSHTPFNLPKKYRELMLSDSLDSSTLGGYFQGIHYADQCLRTFLDRLDQDGILDHSVIVMYGDHEGVHKYFSQEIQNMKPSESWWQENRKEIPLMIYQKQLQGEEIHTIGGQVDIMPTVLYLMGVDEKDYISSTMGRNLLKTDKSFAVLHNREYIGNSDSEKEKEAAVSGMDIAGLIIRSNYFKNYHP